MRWAPVALAVAAALFTASGASHASHTSMPPYRWPDFEPGGDRALNYFLCVPDPPAEWTTAIEQRWDNALLWNFNVQAGNCLAQTTLKWETPDRKCEDLPPFEDVAGCWVTGFGWTLPAFWHSSHWDLQQTLILIDKPKWDPMGSAWKVALMAHEWGHNMGLTDHFLASQQAAGTLMNHMIENPPTYDGPTPADLSSVVCNVYGRCGDFSGDTCTDLLVRQGGDLKIVRGNCGGAFSDQSAVGIGTGWQVFDWLLRPGDFNGNNVNNITGEGCTDVIADESGSPYRAKLYRGNCGQGGQYFKECCGTQIGSGWQVFSWVFAPGDFNGDNCADVIFREGDVLSMVRGNCAGGFIDQTAFTISGTGWGAATWLLGPGDWDSDGCADIVARFGSALLLYRGNCGAGGQYFKTGLGINMGGGVNWSSYNRLASSGDFTGDGCMDLFSRYSAGTLRVHYGNCGTGFNGSGTPVGTGWNIFDYIY